MRHLLTGEYLHEFNTVVADTALDTHNNYNMCQNSKLCSMLVNIGVISKCKKRYAHKTTFIYESITPIMKENISV